MPIYDYLCTECESNFTSIRNMSDRNAPCDLPCPECGKEGGVKKQLSGFTLADPITMNAGSKMDSNLRDRFDAMTSADPNFNWTLGK